MLRFVLFIGLGILAGGGITMLTAPTGSAVWALPVGLMLTILSGVFLGIGKTTGSLSAPDPKLVEAAVGAQRIGLARVEDATATGTSINDVPVYDLDLLVKPLHGPAYATRMRLRIRVSEFLRFAPGSVLPVAILAEGEPDVAPSDDIDERLLSRISLPRSADGLPQRLPERGQLKADGTRAKPLISINPATRWLRVPLFLIALVIAAGAVVYPYRASVMQTVDALQDGRLHADVRDPEVIADALDALREQTGSTAVVEMRVTDTDIWFVSPVSEGAVEADDWWYRRGMLEEYGAASVQPEDAREYFDATEVAWDRVPALIGHAADAAGLSSGLDDADVSFSASRRSIDDIDSDDFMSDIGDVEISISISDDYHSYAFTADADGSNLTALQ